MGRMDYVNWQEASDDLEAMAGATVPTPYSYIARHYGLTFNVGDRVEFIDGKSILGVVEKPKPSSEHYVNVAFNDGTSGLCHPRSLKIINAD